MTDAQALVAVWRSWARRSRSAAPTAPATARPATSRRGSSRPTEAGLRKAGTRWLPSALRRGSRFDSTGRRREGGVRLAADGQMLEELGAEPVDLHFG